MNNKCKREEDGDGDGGIERGWIRKHTKLVKKRRESEIAVKVI